MQDLLATKRGARPRMRAAEILGRRIVSGGLLPGTLLPDLDQLADELSISRLAVRDAVKLLEEKGLVLAKPRHGIVVRPQSEWSRLDIDVLLWQIADLPDAAFVSNLFEVRRIIEPDAAAIVAAHRPAEAIAEMERALAVMAANEPQADLSIRADLTFHRTLLTGTGNEFIASFAPLVEALLLAVFRLQRDTLPDPAEFVPSHRAVLDAIRRGDAEAARRASTRLLESAERDAINGIRRLAAADERTARSMSQ